MNELKDKNLDLEDHEDHIDMLKELDKWRVESGGMRDIGVEALQEWFEQIKAPFSNRDQRDRRTQYQYLNDISALKVLSHYSKEPQEDVLSVMRQFVDGLTLVSIAEHPISVLLATEVMQTFVPIPGYVFTRPVMLSYYWIVREIYSSDSPDWSTGGARAGGGGRVSAFTTAECLGAILSFIIAQENTARFLGKVGEIIKRKKGLEHEDIPTDWRKAEIERLSLSGCTTLRILGLNSHDIVRVFLR